LNAIERIQNKNDNLNEFGHKHKNFKDEYKIEELVSATDIVENF
jgi:hypothetical protein